MPKMESHIAEGLGDPHLSETSAKMGYVGFCLISFQLPSPQYASALTLRPLPYTQPNLKLIWHVFIPSSPPDSSIDSFPPSTPNSS